jgi:hypothetical protein
VRSLQRGARQGSACDDLHSGSPVFASPGPCAQGTAQQRVGTDKAGWCARFAGSRWSPALPLNAVLCRCRLARDERGDDAPRRAPSIKVYPGARSGSAWLQARSTTAPRLCIQCAACSAVLGRVQPAMIFTVALRSSLHQVPARRALHNNALERTRRVGVPASRAVVGVPPCRSTRCCAETAGCTSTAKDDGSVPRSGSARPGAPRVPVAGRYGGCLQASAVIPGGGKAWPGSASLAQRHHLLHASVALSNSFSALQGSTAAGWHRLQQNRNATVPHNNAFERTRRVGVPRLRGAIVRVPPCRSTQCWTGVECREVAGGTPLVAVPESASTGIPGPVQLGSQRERYGGRVSGSACTPTARLSAVLQPAMIFTMAPGSSLHKFPARGSLSN